MGTEREAELLAPLAPTRARPIAGGRNSRGVGRTRAPGSSAEDERNDHSRHAYPRRGPTSSGARRAGRRRAAEPECPRGGAAPYLRPRGWRCRRWCAPPACAWRRPGSGADQEPGPKPWLSEGDGDRRKMRRRPTAWSPLLGAPSAAGLSCSSWTRQRAALPSPGLPPRRAPVAAAARSGSRFRRGVSRRWRPRAEPGDATPAESLSQAAPVSSGRLRRKSPAAESQRANGDMGMWPGGQRSQRP